MRKETSPAKIESNRKNAQSSTGPRTPEGKSAVKWNAVKHGLLAKEAVITAGEGKELKAEFDALFKSLVDDLKPVGVLEEMLVEKIAVCYWRSRRAMRCENGEIKGTLDTLRFEWSKQQDEAVREIMETIDYVGDGWEHRLCRSSAGIECMLGLIERLRSDMDEYGYFTERGGKEVIRVFGNTDGTDGHLLLFYHGLTDEKEQSTAKASVRDSNEVPNPEDCEKAILYLLSQKEKAHRARLKIVSAQEEMHLRAEAAKAALPGEKSMERLQRYETSIERQLYKAMNLLERLQGKRRGEFVSPTINLEVNSQQ